MASYEEGGGVGMTMNVAPTGNGGNGGMGGFGDGWWFILLLLCCGNGMWGGMGGGMWPMMMNGMWGGMGGLYPWLDNSQHISDGFRDQQLQTTVASIGDRMTSGFGDVQTALCGGFAGVNAAVNGAQNAVSQQLYTNQIADMERSYAAQTAAQQNANALQAQLAQCCCDNRAATADVKYTIGTESASNRFAGQSNTRDIIENQNRMGQAILDKLCALELDGVKNQLAQAQRENTGLQNQLNMAALRESQTAQNAFIAQGFANEVDQLYNRLNSCPVPSTPVFGRTPIFTCGSNTGCGCGGNGFAA